MDLFLEQTSIVQTLIENVVKSLNYIQDNEAKSKLINALEPFYYSVVPTIIDIDEIKTIAQEYAIPLTHIEALKILDSVRLDIDLNCTNESIKHHFNEFIDESI